MNTSAVTLIVIMLTHTTLATCWGSCATGSCSGLGTCNNPFGFLNAVGNSIGHPEWGFDPRRVHAPIPSFAEQNRMYSTSRDARIWEMDFNKRHALRW
jgi:hypothetical protein